MTSIDGTVITANDDWNKAYYGKAVLAPDIITRGGVHNKQADKILADITKAAKAK